MILTLSLLVLILAGHAQAQMEPAPLASGPTGLRFLGSAPPPPPEPAGLVALYTFAAGSGNSVLDRAGTLALAISDPGALQWLPGGGLTIKAPVWIRSSGPASALTEAVKRSGELTVEAWVKPANTTQGGPARMVALSENGHAGANVMLGQLQAQFVLRLRTTATDVLGMPDIVTPAGSAAAALTYVVATRAPDGATRLYVNGVQRASAQGAGTLSNWDAGYILALANEAGPDGNGRDRPWLGELHRVAVWARALTGAEIKANFDAGVNR